MYIEEVISELLYIGLVAEKGRCHGTIWRIRYRSVLKKHIKALYELSKCLCVTDEEELQKSVDKFIDLCAKNPDIGRCYPYQTTKLINIQHMSHSERIDKMMDDLFQVLLCELDKIIIDEKKVWRILRVLHNLPRVYFGTRGETLCGINKNRISEEDALSYAFENMDDEMKKTYMH